MTESDGAYDRNLRHVVEPGSPSERDSAISARIEDYEALWLSDILRNHAHYGEHEYQDESGIAVAYASYINQKVIKEGNSWVNLYAHTEDAIETLLNAILQNRQEHFQSDDFPIVMYNRIASEFADSFINSDLGNKIDDEKIMTLESTTTMYNE